MHDKARTTRHNHVYKLIDRLTTTKLLKPDTLTFGASKFTRHSRRATHSFILNHPLKHHRLPQKVLQVVETLIVGKDLKIYISALENIRKITDMPVQKFFV